MNRHLVHTEGRALAYLVDCTLATVCDMASKKRRPKQEFERQISIAQTGVDWLRRFGVSCHDTRAAEVIGQFKGSVQAWANHFEPPN